MENSPEYYARRGNKEREMAEAARDPQIAKIHQELAEHYEMLVALSRDPKEKRNGQ